MIINPSHADEIETKIKLVQSDAHSNTGTIEIESNNQTQDKTD